MNGVNKNNGRAQPKGRRRADRDSNIIISTKQNSRVVLHLINVSRSRYYIQFPAVRPFFFSLAVRLVFCLVTYMKIQLLLPYTYNIPHGARCVVRRMFARLTPMNRFNYFKHDLLPLLEYSDVFFPLDFSFFFDSISIQQSYEKYYTMKNNRQKSTFFFINKNLLSVRAAALALLL